MTNTIFTSKEQYLSFRAAWAKSVNDAQRLGKKYYEDFGSISPEHHMLYNILRGKHPECGFTRITNPNKLNNGTWCNHASFYASMRLNSYQRTAIDILEARKSQADGGKKALPAVFLQERLNRFLEVFEGTITAEMFAAMPRIKNIPPVPKIPKQEAA